MAASPHSRRSFLKMTAAGVPIVAGGALITKGGLLVADLWWRERNVGDLAANTGRAQALHDLTTVPAPQPQAPIVVPDLPQNILPTVVPADAVTGGSAGGKPIVGRLKIDSIRVDAAIVRVAIAYNGDQPYWETADHAVGWHEGTGTPGAPTGNVVISGHISSRNQGAVFHRLPEVKVGDESRITISGSPTVVYRVVDKLVVNPTDVWVMDQTKAPIATFICCVPDGVYSQRLVVVSEPV